MSKLNDETMKELTGETDKEYNEKCKLQDKLKKRNCQIADLKHRIKELKNEIINRKSLNA